MDADLTGDVIRRAIFLTLTLLALVATATAPAGASSHRPDTERIAGATRYATAAALATAAAPQGSPTVLMATGQDHPDALAASGLAGALESPVVLTARESLSQPTLDALDQLGAEKVVILGGTKAVSPVVEEELRARGYATDRIAGASRVDTAAKAARRMGNRIGTVEGERAAVVASGTSFADALAAGPLAHRAPVPVMLTAEDRLSSATASALDDLAIEHAVVAGGTAVVSEAVAQDIRDRGIRVTRIGGRDRTDTAVRMAQFSERTTGIGSERIVASRGDAFPDALAAAPYASATGAPVVLTRDPRAVSYDLLQYLVDRGGAVAYITAVGGTRALTSGTLGRLATAARTPEQTVEYEVGSAGEIDSSLAYFAEHVDWTLTDQRGWALGNEHRFSQVASGGEFTIHLASPQAVEDAAPVCSDEYSCRVGSDIYINEERWNRTTDTYDDRARTAYRHYVVNHEIGHWIGLGHRNDHQCAPGGPAPVMMQQSKREYNGCDENVWPLDDELADADRMLGDGSSHRTASAVAQEE